MVVGAVFTRRRAGTGLETETSPTGTRSDEARANTQPWRLPSFYRKLGIGWRNELARVLMVNGIVN
jgi:hypothetical protein